MKFVMFEYENRFLPKFSLYIAIQKLDFPAFANQKCTKMTTGS